MCSLILPSEGRARAKDAPIGSQCDETCGRRAARKGGAPPNHTLQLTSDKGVLASLALIWFACNLTWGVRKRREGVVVAIPELQRRDPCATAYREETLRCYGPVA